MNKCPLCKKWSAEYNAAVANNLIIEANQILRRLDGHYRSAHGLPKRIDWKL